MMQRCHWQARDGSVELWQRLVLFVVPHFAGQDILTAVAACLNAVKLVLALLSLDVADDESSQVGIQVLLHLGLFL